ELLERAKRIVGETDRLIRDFQGQASLTSGRVAISVSPTVATGLIARFLVLFEQEFPSITVSVREDLGAAMFEALETADVELGIGPYAEAPERLSFRPLFEQPFFLIVAADHPLARRGHARLADLAGLALLCPARGTTARAVIDDAARAAGLALQPKYEATQHDTLVSMAAAGLGATVMPAGDRRVLAALGVAAVPFEDARLSRKVGVLSRRHEPLTAPAAAFLRLLLLVATGGIAVGDTGLRPIVADAPGI
ncbi:MAG: LysR substrate-binding domain-containing protein, partial [Alphaproteobacteria bacterium]